MKKISLLIALFFYQSLGQTQNQTFELIVQDKSEMIQKEIEETSKEQSIIESDGEEEILFVKKNEPTVDSWQLLIQSKNKDYEKMNNFVINGISINKPVINTNTVLHLAGMQSNLKLAEYALSHNANINVLNKNNETVLHWAASSKIPLILQEELALISPKDKLLLLNKLNKDNRTALHFNALYNGNLQITKVLLDNKINIDIQDKQGQTALHYAIALGKWDLSLMLIKSGANIILKDNNGLTAEDYLMERGNSEGFIKLFHILSESNKNIINTRLLVSRVISIPLV